MRSARSRRLSIRCLPALAALLCAAPAPAEIYRCETEQAVEFSDRPCGQGTIHDPDRVSLSFVAPDEHLPELAAAARAFIADRRKALESGGTRPDAQARAPGYPATEPAAVAAPWAVPWPIPPGRHRRAFENPGASPPPGPERYSPLNGPILGTSGRERFRARLSAPEDPANRR